MTGLSFIVPWLGCPIDEEYATQPTTSRVPHQGDIAEVLDVAEGRLRLIGWAKKGDIVEDCTVVDKQAVDA